MMTKETYHGHNVVTALSGYRARVSAPAGDVVVTYDPECLARDVSPDLHTRKTGATLLTARLADLAIAAKFRGVSTRAAIEEDAMQQGYSWALRHIA